MRLYAYAALGLACVVASDPALARSGSRHHARQPVAVLAGTPVLSHYDRLGPEAEMTGAYAQSVRVRPVRVAVANPADAPPAFGGMMPLAGGPAVAPAGAGNSALSAMAARHAQANGLPMELVHRVIMRESRYNPRAVSKGNYGIMQIRLGTARAMGYSGSAAGLLDPEVNMTYAVKYLAGAYRAAGGNHSRAVSYYASGYYAQAKQRGFSPYAAPVNAGPAAF